LSEDGHKLEKSTEYHITVTIEFFLHFNVNKIVQKHKNISLYWSNNFPISHSLHHSYCFRHFFQNILQYICSFRSSERALFCIFVPGVFQDMAAIAFDRYLSKQTQFTKKEQNRQSCFGKNQKNRYKPRFSAHLPL